jgi:hypothetical protein
MLSRGGKKWGNNNKEQRGCILAFLGNELYAASTNK